MVTRVRKFNPDVKREYMRNYRADPSVKVRKNEWSRKDRLKKPGTYAAAARKKRYGITPEQFDALLVAQGDKCAICRTDRPSGKGDWHVDHCHTTGKIRGLLCAKCNCGLGFFQESTLVLESATRYMRKHYEQRNE